MEFVEDGTQGVTLFGAFVPIVLWVVGLAEQFGWLRAFSSLFKIPLETLEDFARDAETAANAAEKRASDAEPEGQSTDVGVRYGLFYPSGRS